MADYSDQARFKLADLLRNGRGLLSDAQQTPTGSLLSALLSGSAAEKYVGNPLTSLLGNPQTPAMFNTPENQQTMSVAQNFMPMGIINKTGLLGKLGLPQEISSQVVRPSMNSVPGNPLWDAAGNVINSPSMSLQINALKDGGYVGHYQPPWMKGGKGFFATGDDPVELANYGLGKIAGSEKGIAASNTAKFNKSLLGQLKKLGFNPDDFSHAASTQSSSSYLTHNPTGVKIRLADHDLPLHYEQPDVDLRTWMTNEEKMAAIKKALE